MRLAAFRILLAFVLLSSPSLSAQEYFRGAVLDEARYEGLPRKATLLARSYQGLPKAVSLKRYAPSPGNQGRYGTCVAWSSAYAARTISESEALGRTDRDLTTSNVFSPAFVYKNISMDPSCQTGTCISDALDLIKSRGVPKMQKAERETEFKAISLSQFVDSPKYRIAGYATLFSFGRSQSELGELQLDIVKRSLAEGKPVVIGMNCPDSFFAAKDCWRPNEAPNVDYGGHAMCVVGYDDQKYGGAFEIQNSWGSDWGNDGYIWIGYGDFARFVDEAYEMIEDLAAYKDAAVFSGSVVPRLYMSKEAMPAHFTRHGYYQLDKAYPSGTEFQLFIGNGSPAYVYAFASDDGGKANRIFPAPGSNISPVLDYADNTVVFPDEFSSIDLDSNPGNDYLIVLYAKRPLDIDAIVTAYEGASGPLADRVGQAVGAHFIPPDRVRYEPNKIAFNVRTADTEAVFGLLFVIEHSASRK